MLTRRDWLRRVGIATACGLIKPSLWAQGAPLADVAMQLGWIWNVEYAGELVGLAKGYYQAEGLNLNIRPGGPQLDVMVMLMTRKAMVSISDVMTSGQAVNHGAKVKIVGSTFQRNPFAIISLPGKPIHTPQDLVGKKIGVPTNQVWALKSLCVANNIQLQSVNIVPVGYDPAPLVNQQVDGYLAFLTNEPIQLAHVGIATVTMAFADFGLAEFSDTVTVREDALEDPAQRAMLKKIVRGTIRGWQDAIAQPEAAAKLMMDRNGAQYSLNEDVQMKALKAEIPLISTPESQKNGLLSMSEETIAANIETFGRVGVTIRRSLFDTTLIQEIMGGHATL